MTRMSLLLMVALLPLLPSCSKPDKAAASQAAAVPEATEAAPEAAAGAPQEKGAAPKARAPLCQEDVLKSLSPEEKAGWDLLQALSPRHLGAILVWPERYQATVAALGPVLEALPLHPAVRSAILESDSLPTLLARLDLRLPGMLDGWDPSRPMVFAFAATDARFSSAFSVIETLLKYRQGLPGLRHRLLLPARDAAALAASLRSAAAGMGIVPVSHPLPPGVPAGAAAFDVPGGAALLIPEEGRVRIELVTGALPRLPLEEGRPGVDLAELARPDAALLAPTPAVRKAIATGQAAALYLRGRLLREAGAWMAAHMVMQALSMVEASMRDLLLAQGTGEVLTGYLLMDPWLSLHDEITLGVAAVPGGLRVQAVAELTLEGRRLLAAARPGETGSLRFADKPYAVRAEVGIDLGALVAAAGVPALLRGQDAVRVDEVARAFHECGAACLVQAAAGGWPSELAVLARVLGRQWGIEPADLLGRSFALVVSPPATDQAPRAAVALRLPAGADPARSKAAGEKAATGLRVPLDTKLLERPDGSWLVVGLGASGEGLFDLAAAAAGDRGLVHLDVVPPAVAGPLGMGDPGLDRLLAAVPRVVFASRLAGDVVVADAVAAFKPEAALEVPAKLELAALPVAVGGAASKAEQCEAAAAATVRGWLIALARSTPDLRAALVARGLEDLERAAACAADDQAFAAALSALEATLRELTAGLTGVRP